MSLHSCCKWWSHTVYVYVCAHKLSKALCQYLISQSNHLHTIHSIFDYVIWLCFTFCTPTAILSNCSSRMSKVREQRGSSSWVDSKPGAYSPTSLHVYSLYIRTYVPIHSYIHNIMHVRTYVQHHTYVHIVRMYIHTCFFICCCSPRLLLWIY